MNHQQWKKLLGPSNIALFVFLHNLIIIVILTEFGKALFSLVAAYALLGVSPQLATETRLKFKTTFLG